MKRSPWLPGQSTAGALHHTVTSMVWNYVTHQAAGSAVVMEACLQYGFMYLKRETPRPKPRRSRNPYLLKLPGRDSNPRQGD